MSHPFTEADIEQAIEATESNLSRNVVDDLLTAVQEDIEDNWRDTHEAIERRGLRLVTEDSGVKVLADETGEYWQSVFDALTNYENLLGIVDGNAPDVVLATHVAAASRLTPEDWSKANPVVVEVPEPGSP